MASSPRSMTRLLFFINIVMIFALLLVSGAPEIQFSFGRVQGVDKFASITQRPYNAYYGIPFAQPPLGNLRFRAPQPFVGSGPNVVISSNKFRDGCSQPPVDGATISYSEDCLYLNVFTPADLTNVKKVMFWIHGGGYTLGDASQYSPSRLVTDNDVIVVTTHYRLGPFGFLSADKANANNGLRDQILALKWVKDNIGQFGGDPDDITIFGESAGSTSVSLLSISPLTKGLFTKAIMQSGTALSFWAVNLNPEALLYQSAGRLGCPAASWFLRWFNRGLFESNLMECIRSKPEQELISLFPSVSTGVTEDDAENRFDWDDYYGTSAYFAPSVDGEVIPRSPRSLMADRRYLQEVGALDRDYIIGFNNNEGLLSLAMALGATPLDVLTMPDTALTVMKSTVTPMFPYVKSLSPEAVDMLEYGYTYPRLEDGRVPVQGLLDVSTDSLFALPSVEFARIVTGFSDRTNVYLYLFDHYPEVKDPSGPFQGMDHAMDLLYEFDNDQIYDEGIGFYANIPSPTDGNLEDIFRGVVTQFAKTGNPSRLTAEPRNWPRFDPKQEYYMALSPTPEVRQHVYAKRISLWTDFIYKKV